LYRRYGLIKLFDLSEQLLIAGRDENILTLLDKNYKNYFKNNIVFFK